MMAVNASKWITDDVLLCYSFLLLCFLFCFVLFARFALLWFALP